MLNTVSSGRISQLRSVPPLACTEHIYTSFLCGRWPIHKKQVPTMLRVTQYVHCNYCSAAQPPEHPREHYRHSLNCHKHILSYIVQSSTTALHSINSSCRTLFQHNDIMSKWIKCIAIFWIYKILSGQKGELHLNQTKSTLHTTNWRLYKNGIS